MTQQSKAVTQCEVRRGSYYDSIVLMQLQAALAELPGVKDAGVMMGTAANKEMLAASNLLTTEATAAGADDLVIVVQAEDEAQARAALGEVDRLLTRRSASNEESYLPQSLPAALDMLPEAQWVLISVPGRYAARVAREALQQGRNLFLYSDNVSLEDEVALKEEAARRSLLLMGPDCGTAIVNGIGFGFANRVRRGSIGIVAASGTGLQAVSSEIHRLGGGISHALGTGGRDLSEQVGGLAALQAIRWLAADPQTEVIVLVSKPPAPAVAEQVLAAARATGKPVVANFVGYQSPAAQVGRLYFASTFATAAERAVTLVEQPVAPLAGSEPGHPFAAGQRFLRGLFSGGTLAYEAQLLLAPYLGPFYSNVPLDKKYRLENPHVSRTHTIVDMGEDTFTVGRLHPMMDHDLRIRRIQQEASDPEVVLLLLDVVLGDGAHADPAGALGPAIRAAKQQAKEAGRFLEVVMLVVGTEEDPQGLEEQVSGLRAAGAHVVRQGEAAARHAGTLLRSLAPVETQPAPAHRSALHEPVIAVNVGVTLFADSLAAQGATVLPVRWKPPASGNERLASLLERMR